MRNYYNIRKWFEMYNKTILLSYMSLKNIIIFDINETFIEEAKRLQKYGITVIKSRVEDLIKNRKLNFIVSPANCFGFMNGGIDKIYMSIFNDIQNTVQNKIKMIGLKTKSGRNYLPIGSAITVPTNNPKCPNLICAPTMFYPSNILGTDNVIFCFVAIIYLALQNNNMVIGCPGLGTGVGQMPPKNVVDQLEKAIQKYNFIINHEYYAKINIYKDQHNFILGKMACDQLQNYMNIDIP